MVGVTWGSLCGASSGEFEERQRSQEAAESVISYRSVASATGRQLLSEVFFVNNMIPAADPTVFTQWKNAVTDALSSKSAFVPLNLRTEPHDP